MKKIAMALLPIALFSAAVSAVGATRPKFRPATPGGAGDNRYVVTLNEEAAMDDPATLRKELALTYGARLEAKASSDARQFTVTTTSARARLLSTDPRVMEVVEVPLTTPAPSQTSASSAHLTPRPAGYGDNGQSGTYSYDGAGNIIAIGADTYVYDGAQRLVSSVTRGVQENYTYDAYGNRTSATGAVNCLGQANCAQTVTVDSTTNHLITINGATVTYDAPGNIKTIAATSGSPSAVYAYDGLGMMTEATVGSDDRQFLYTADDERIAVRQGASWTWMIRDQSGKVLREATSLQSGSGSNLTMTNWQWAKDYVWRDGLLLATVSPSGTLHYHLDHLGTPRLVTDANGVKVAEHAYYPFGTEINLTPHETPEEAMKFTGHERDIVAGEGYTLDYMHARYFSASVGRFLSADPSLDIEGSMRLPQKWNRYAYVGNNPLKYTDPDGKDWLAAWLLGESYRNVSTWNAIFNRDTIADVNRGRQEWAEDHRSATHGWSPVPTTKTEVAMQMVMMGPIGEFVGASFGKLGTVVANQVGKITGFSGHALDQIITRGVSPALLKAVTSKPIAVLEQSAGQKLFLTKEGAVVLDKGGKVITAYTAKEFDKKILDVLERATARQ